MACRWLFTAAIAVALVLAAGPSGVTAGDITPEGDAALKRGLAWLAKNQGPEGNWESNDLGLVAVGALAFLADGHTPGVGKYGKNVEKSLNYILKSAKPSGLLNVADAQRDMYNHGLATFVLGQAHGMTGDPRISPVLDRALKLIAGTQCNDGGWDYRARRQPNGHDLSLAVMQAKALRSAVDSGLEVPPEVIEMAIKSVREHYSPAAGGYRASEVEQRKHPGQFTYTKGGGRGTIAMAAAGVVCMQEFGQYDDWRIGKNLDVITAAIKQQKETKSHNGNMPFDAYTLYYVGQAIYQAGGNYWSDNYPKLRDQLIGTQVIEPDNIKRDGSWQSNGHLGGQPGVLYGTSVACFILAIPNRYLPILQEGKIENLRDKFQAKAE